MYSVHIWYQHSFSDLDALIPDNPVGSMVFEKHILFTDISKRLHYDCFKHFI